MRMERMKADKTQRRLPPEERRSQLIRSAVKIAAIKGLGRVVHADVARESGVSVPTAFLYLKDREALLKAIIGEVGRYYRAMALEQHSADAPPLQRIRNHVRAFGDSIDTDPDYAIVWLEWSTTFRNEYGLWDAFMDFQEYVIANLTRSIRKCQKEGASPAGIVAADSARLLVAGAYALAQLKLMKRPPAKVKRYAEQMLKMALQGG
jgi:TetR/AcrR family hemagglutinin/protease transcriptional regulator